jgi:hypothetical protein
MAARLGSQGAAPSTLQTKEYVPRLFDAFRSSNDELKNLYKQPWERLPEKVCAGRDVYERFAFYLTDVHVKEGTTKHVKYSTALDYMGVLINLACDKFKANGTADTKLFFTCLDTKSNADSAVWWRKLKDNIVRKGFQHIRDNGEAFDQSASPLYLDDMKALNRAYSMEGSKEVSHASPAHAHARISTHAHLINCDSAVCRRRPRES